MNEKFLARCRNCRKLRLVSDRLIAKHGPGCPRCRAQQMIVPGFRLWPHERVLVAIWWVREFIAEPIDDRGVLHPEWRWWKNPGDVARLLWVSVFPRHWEGVDNA